MQSPEEDQKRKIIMADKEYIPGGEAEGMDAQAIADKHGVDIELIVEQLEAGIEVEYEHTKDPNVAKEIAKDHLVESPFYYTYLEDMEEEMEENLSGDIEKRMEGTKKEEEEEAEIEKVAKKGTGVPLESQPQEDNLEDAKKKKKKDDDEEEEEDDDKKNKNKKEEKKESKDEMGEGEEEEEEKEPTGTKKASMSAVVEFLRKNPNPDDKKVHAWAEKSGYEIHGLEKIFYSLATKYVKSLGTKKDSRLIEDIKQDTLKRLFG